MISVEILPAEQRSNVDLPQKALHAVGTGDKQILVGHPFQLYNVVGPSKLIFNDLETLKSEIADRTSRKPVTITSNGNDVDAPPSATTVTVEPAPGATVPSNQQFTLTLNQGVQFVDVNGAPATGSGANWTWTPNPPLREGAVNLHVAWTNRDGSSGSKAVGPYIVKDPD